MIYFSYTDSYDESVDEPSLNLAVRGVLSHQKINPENVDLTIVVTNDAGIKDLNRQYSGVDAPTDVLSFLLNEKDPETGLLYLGDVVISYPRAEEQSIKAGHTAMAEIILLTVHGILHLLGYDHAEPEAKEKMWQVQQQILDLLKIKVNQWPVD